jgi:hypothetical protein
MREKIKWSSDGGDTGGVWESLRLAGVWSQAVGFVLVHWQESGFSLREDVFTLNLFHTEILSILYVQYDLQR